MSFANKPFSNPPIADSKPSLRSIRAETRYNSKLDASNFHLKSNVKLNASAILNATRNVTSRVAQRRLSISQMNDQFETLQMKIDILIPPTPLNRNPSLSTAPRTRRSMPKDSDRLAVDVYEKRLSNSSVRLTPITSPQTILPTLLQAPDIQSTKRQIHTMLSPISPIQRYGEGESLQYLIKLYEKRSVELDLICTDTASRNRVGLNNLGNTCYMNATLQCLRSINCSPESTKKDSISVGNFFMLTTDQSIVKLV